MTSTADIDKLIADTQATIDDAARRLDARHQQRDAAAGLAAGWLQQRAHDAWAAAAREQVGRAQWQQPIDAPIVPPDSKSLLARRIGQRRKLV